MKRLKDGKTLVSVNNFLDATFETYHYPFSEFHQGFQCHTSCHLPKSYAEHKGWWEAQPNNSLSVSVSICLALLFSVCLTAWESLSLDASLPFSLSTYISTWLPADQTNLPASFSTRWPPVERTENVFRNNWSEKLQI